MEFNIFKNCIASKVQAKVYSVWLLTQHDDNGISYKKGYVQEGLNRFMLTLKCPKRTDKLHFKFDWVSSTESEDLWKYVSLESTELKDTSAAEPTHTRLHTPPVATEGQELERMDRPQIPTRVRGTGQRM